MTIINAVQRGSTVTVYGKNNLILLTLVGQLHGFTGSTVNIKSGIVINTYNEKGHIISTVPA